MVKIRSLELGDFPLLLAPMEDVSDPPFRALCKQHGADMMYTEFISSEGLIRDAVKSVQKMDIFEYERPIGVQIFGSEAHEIATDRLMGFMAKYRDHFGTQLSELDLGGGFGIAYVAGEVTVEPTDVLPAIHSAVQAGRDDGCGNRDAGKARLRYRHPAGPPVRRGHRTAADHRQFRADGLWYRRGFWLPGARSARLGFCSCNEVTCARCCRNR